MADRQVGSAGVQADVGLPSGPGTQVAGIGLHLEVNLPTGVNFGWLGALVEVFPVLVPSNAARWSGALFEMGTSSPLSYWSGSQFLGSGTKPVLWVTDHFEVAP